jgi:FkbM family methyltransferase
MVKCHQARCIAVEPNPTLADEIFRRRVAEQVLQVAIGKTNGTATLAIFDKDDASTLHPGAGLGTVADVEVPTWTLRDLIDRLSLPRIDLLKVDIEGLEVYGLTSLEPDQLQHISQICVEFHDSQRYITRADIQEVYLYLSDTGYRRFRSSVRDHSDVLFVRSELLDGLTSFFTSVVRIPSNAMLRYSRRILKLDYP